MNIHAHAGLPPTPFIFEMAAANRPENAPESYEKIYHCSFNYHGHICGKTDRSSGEEKANTALGTQLSIKSSDE